LPDSNLSDNSNYESMRFVIEELLKLFKLERDYTSDSELYNNSSTTGKIDRNATSDSNLTIVSPQPRNDWILVLVLVLSFSKPFFQLISFVLIKVNKEDLDYAKRQNLVNQYKIDIDTGLEQHDKKAFLKFCEILSILVRDEAHITPDNFQSCIHCLRTFVYADKVIKFTNDLLVCSIFLFIILLFINSNSFSAMLFQNY
jgi:hypothetical protein